MVLNFEIHTPDFLNHHNSGSIFFSNHICIKCLIIENKNNNCTIEIKVSSNKFNNRMLQTTLNTKMHQREMLATHSWMYTLLLIGLLFKKSTQFSLLKWL